MFVCAFFFINFHFPFFLRRLGKMVGVG